jgi:hypothetical protein
MKNQILSEGLTNLQQSIEDWSLHYLNPESISFGTYLMFFFMVMLLISIYLITERRFKKCFEWMSRHLLGTALVLWLMGVLVYIVGFYHNQLNGLAIVPRAVISSFKMFAVSNDLARVHEVLRKDALYMSAFSLVHFAAAYITFLFVFKMVGYKIKSSLKILIYKWFKAKGRNAHVFWGVNEASLLLAENIRLNNKQDTIVFIDVDEQGGDSSPKKTTLLQITDTMTIRNQDLEKLVEIDALVDHCFNGPAALMENDDIFGSLQLRNIGTIVQKSVRTCFYFFSDDEEQNVKAAVHIQQDRLLKALEKKPLIYVHARKSANNEVVDHYLQYDDHASWMEIKVVDSAILSFDKLKQDQYTWFLPVNSVVFDSNTGTVSSPFAAMVVGFGGTGLEAFKFLYEYSAFVDKDGKKTPFKCYAIDRKMDKMAGLIRSKMLAITKEELDLIQAEVDSEKFWNQIHAIIDEVNYVVITLNDDASGLSLAVNLFKYAIIHRHPQLPKLKILLRCYGKDAEERMDEVVNNLNRSIETDRVEIRIFGKAKELFSYEMILSETILKEAKEFNLVYEGSDFSADEQWKRNFGEEEMKRLMETKSMSRYHAIYDINRRIRQNVSNVQHRNTKLILMGLDGKDAVSRLECYAEWIAARNEGSVAYPCSDAEKILLHNLARVEHERWIASHKLMGYIYNKVNDCVQKHHCCLCPWEALDEVTQSYDCNVVDTTLRLAGRNG